MVELAIYVEQSRQVFEWKDKRIQEDIDPKLKRTVVVSTKLDTRIKQWTCAADAKAFITPTSHFQSLELLGGGPFFTSVPSGRVVSEECEWSTYVIHLTA